MTNHIVSADELHAYALEKAPALASKAPEAFAVARRLMRGNKTQLDAHMAEEGETSGLAVRGREAREAFSASLEKRKPAF
jgi:enoyl-CoA hydratase/carnithine racemase